MNVVIGEKNKQYLHFRKHEGLLYNSESDSKLASGLQKEMTRVEAAGLRDAKQRKRINGIVHRALQARSKPHFSSFLLIICENDNMKTEL